MNSLVEGSLELPLGCVFVEELRSVEDCLLDQVGIDDGGWANDGHGDLVGGDMVLAGGSFDGEVVGLVGGDVRDGEVGGLGQHD